MPSEILVIASCILANHLHSFLLLLLLLTVAHLPRRMHWIVVLKPYSLPSL